MATRVPPRPLPSVIADEVGGVETCQLAKDWAQWMAEYGRDRCFLCGESKRLLHVHHICGGSGRKNDARNYSFLCRECHGDYHDKYPEWFPLVVVAKAVLDPTNYDLDYLMSLRVAQPKALCLKAAEQHAWLKRLGRELPL